MSASRPPPIRDFASLKEAWGTEGKESSFDPRQTSPDNAPNPSGQPAPQESKPPLSDIPVPATHTQDPQLEDQLRQAHLSIKDLAEKNRALLEQVARLEHDVAAKEATNVDLLEKIRQLAQQQAEREQADSTKLASIDALEMALARDRALLETDRSLFETQLDELDKVKTREAEVIGLEAALNRRLDELDRRTIAVGDLEASKADLDTQLLAISAVQADLQTALSDLRSSRRALNKKTDEAEALATKADQLTSKLESLQERNRALKRQHSDLQSQFASSEQALHERTRELASSRSKLERMRTEWEEAKLSLASIPDLTINSEAVLQWLAQDATAECIGLDEDARLGWSGIGSYERDAFDRLLGGLDIQQFEIPHPSITHVVVGRNGWSKENLLAQIDMREGETLRVYSQELLLAALITGRDPLEDPDAEVLESFRRGHPALEFLAQSELEWPSVFTTDTSIVDGTSLESLGVNKSPLHFLGYMTGKRTVLSQQDRHQILQEAFERESLPWVESDEYMENWGTARSHQRLWRIAAHLAFLVNRPFGRDWRKQQSRDDWIEDLDWLHDRFYRSRRFRFRWPDVSVS
jgi:predicted  nucleic acid-binding Zn-ribbon protein